jgi:hypothetical protein
MIILQAIKEFLEFIFVLIMTPILLCISVTLVILDKLFKEENEVKK